MGENSVIRPVYVDKAHSDFVKLMTRSGKGEQACFETYADFLAFAASFAAAESDLISVSNRSMNNPDPIEYQIFLNRNYGPLIDLIAAFKLGDIKSLSGTEDGTNARIEIFEGFANAGIQILKEKLSAHHDKLSGLELILQKYRPSESDDELDLSTLATTS